MDQKEKTEKHWKRVLSAQAYAVLRKGHMEDVNSGKYVHEKGRGVYHCAGCSTPLFHSSSKFDAGSGYATFQEPIQQEGVLLSSTYTEAGDTETRLLCPNCNGVLGRLSSMEIQSDANLVEGTVSRTYVVNSAALKFKKAVTPSNYPIATVLFMLLLVAGGYAVWLWGSELVATAQLRNADGVILMWAGDTELHATLLRLETMDQADPTLISGRHVLLVDVEGIDGTPRVRFANHPMDLVWLDTNFAVVAFEKGRSATQSVLEIPEGARYALITQQHVLSDQVFIIGFSFLVTDRTTLL